ncbi:hypothetical protein DSM107133_02755 [Pseudosulfitobacter sp. DSM 107133]|nr:hypothetical protein DSM107133_02755 [Pseudosulfitobacter sp. DSM 107133]
MTQHHLHCAAPTGASGGSFSGKMKGDRGDKTTPLPDANSGLTHAARPAGLHLARGATLQSAARDHFAAIGVNNA